MAHDDNDDDDCHIIIHSFVYSETDDVLSSQLRTLISVYVLILFSIFHTYGKLTHVPLHF